MSAGPENLVALLERSVDRFASNRLFGSKRDGSWHWLSYGEFHQRVAAFAASLEELGVGPGDRVAIVADNCVEWAIAAYASYGRRATYIPMYPSQKPEEWAFILRDSGACAAIGEGKRVVQGLAALKPELPELEHLIGFGASTDGVLDFDALVAAGEKTSGGLERPEPSELAGFIYTSGTTGAPKGVMLSHHNICSNVNALGEIFPFEGESSLSFLPWAHSFGQNAELHNLLSAGCSIAINDDVANLLPNLAEVRPTVLFAVPRVFNRIFDAIGKQIAERPGAIQGLFRLGLTASIDRARGERVGPLRELGRQAADRLIFSKIRDRFGGELRYAVSGSAALSREVAEFIDAIGITVFEGYGLTETSPVVTTNFPENRLMGSVGRTIPGVRVEIDERFGEEGHGEILVYGPNVMQGYHNRPEETEAVLMNDGGFRTGDMGKLDADGFLHITGRIKEQYKLENGKYVVPSPLEEQLKLSPYIANVFLFGDNRPFNVCLVVLDEAAIRGWLEQNSSAADRLHDDPAVRELIAGELTRLGSGFKGFERPKRFEVVSEDFTIENGLLTPTMKLKRERVLEKYQPEISSLYER